MKLTLILFILTIFQLWATETYSQMTKITLKLEDVKISDVLKEIENQSEFYFLYSPKLIDVERNVSIDVEKKPIKDILSNIFDEKVKYVVYDRQILLTPSDITSLSSAMQQLKITGTVTDKNGNPIPGVNVKVEGTTVGAITDINGNYIIEAQNSQSVLLFSFIGYINQEVTIGKSAQINIILLEKVVGLEEVVVIGYGTVKKRDLTGSVASVKGAELTVLPFNNIPQALQGLATGVQVQQNSGAPDANIQIRIRGTNSISGSNEPLWIIDGFPGDQSILNAADIESIEVLKDASAAAIYGSRGANGIIIVTTKKGKVGDMKVEYDGSYTTQTLRKELDLMDASEYARFYNIVWNNTTGKDYFTQDQINSFGKGTNWQDIIFRSAPTQKHSLEISGGNQKTKFSMGTSYLDQAGIVKSNDYRKISVRTSVDHNISKIFSISSNVILTRLDQNNISSMGSLVPYTLAAPPTLTPYNEDGSYSDLNTAYPWSPNDIQNPSAIINENSFKSYSNKIMSNLALTCTPVDGLSIRVSGNIMNDNSRSDNYTRTTFPHSIGIASISFYEDLHLDWDNIITYTKTIANDHNITIMGGINYEKDISKNVGVSGSGFLSNVFGTYNIGAAANLNTPSSSYGEWTMLSYVGRLNYSYKSKYLATFNYRADGSSRYSSGNKWGNFLSGAFAWRISEEAFMKNISQISDLKLRIGYGEVGNTAINPYYTLDILSSDKTAFGNALYSYFSPGTRLPASLKWETTAQSNIGLDVGILGGRFRLTVDYYIKNTRDLLNTVQLPSSLGYTTTVKNVGKMRNSGLELYLNANIFNSGFSWDVSPNISFNRNKVLKLSGGQDLPGSTMSLTVVNDYLNLLREGHPISAFYGYQVSGWDKNGQFTYNDNNNDGLISALDKTFIGDPNPDFIYGLNSNMSWKNFSLNIFIQGTQGNDLYSFSEICFNYKWNNGYNGFKELLYNHWTPDNTNAKYPAITSLVAARMSDYFVYNGSYLRLKNIELAYNIPADKLHINWIKMGQVYVSGQNLLTISKYPWWDPEVNSYGSATSVNQGIDYYSYPTSKGITLGVRFTF